MQAAIEQCNRSPVQQQMIGLDPHVGTGKVHAVELQPAEQGPTPTVKTDVESVWARQVGGLVQ